MAVTPLGTVQFCAEPVYVKVVVVAPAGDAEITADTTASDEARSTDAVVSVASRRDLNRPNEPMRWCSERRDCRELHSLSSPALRVSRDRRLTPAGMSPRHSRSTLVPASENCRCSYGHQPFVREYREPPGQPPSRPSRSCARQFEPANAQKPFLVTHIRSLHLAQALSDHPSRCRRHRAHSGTPVVATPATKVWSPGCRRRHQAGLCYADQRRCRSESAIEGPASPGPGTTQH
jgi:hypothetical protein